jgi:type IV pilus assembly protein PilV
MFIGPSLKQRGGLLLEALIAIVIFSFGILGLIGMQATAIKQSADAKYRADASYLAGQIISQMWVDRSNLNDYIYQESGSPTSTACRFSGTSPAASGNVALWLGNANKHDTVIGALPNANAQILVEPATNKVTVTVCWKAPQETMMHNFITSALISG